MKLFLAIATKVVNILCFWSAGYFFKVNDQTSEGTQNENYVEDEKLKNETAELWRRK